MLHKRVLAFIVVPFVSLIALQSVSRAESVDFNLNSGHQAAAAGNHRKAIRQFNRSLYRFQGSRQAALKGLYKSHVELKNWKSAMAIVRMQSEADPFNSAHHSEHVKLAMLTGNYEVALKSLEAVEKLSGTTDSTITLRGELLVRAGKLREAGSAFDKLIALNPKNPQAYVWKAKTEQASGRIDEAYKLYLAAYTLEPTNQEYASEYVSSALQNKDHEVVKNVGLKCLDLGSNDASCYRSLGQSCLERSCFQTAAKYFASVVALEDTAFDRMKLAEALALSGHPDESDVEFTRIQQKYAGYEPGMRSWLTFLKKRDALVKAGELLKKFHDSKPKSLWAASELAKYYLAADQPELAVQVMQTFADDQNSDSVRVFHAFALAANRQPAKAVDELEDVVDPAFEANFHMGIVHFQDGDFEQAAKTFLKVKPDSPLYPKAKHNAAISLERSGKAGSAAAILARAPPVAEMQKAFDHQATGQNVREPASPSDLKPESLQPQLEWSLPVL